MEQTKFIKIVEELCEFRVKDYLKPGPKNKSSRKILTHQEDCMKWAAKHEPTPCPDCSKMVVNRKTQLRLVNLGTKNQKWQKTCVDCSVYLGRSKDLD